MVVSCSKKEKNMCYCPSLTVRSYLAMQARLNIIYALGKTDAKHGQDVYTSLLDQEYLDTDFSDKLELLGPARKRSSTAVQAWKKKLTKKRKSIY